MAHKFINGSLVELTSEELTALQSKKDDWLTAEPSRRALTIRSKRDSLLSDTDWMALSDVTMSTEMQSYRQALRDITSQAGFPYSVTWPTKP